MRTVGVVTGTRADFGIYLPVLREIGKTSAIQSVVLACGTHLETSYGNTAHEIEQAGIRITHRVKTFAGAETPTNICRSMAKTISGFSKVFSKDRPDILLVLGDRYEMFAAATAALVYKLPIAHIHGGELSEGANDDAFRHSLTKMSHLHFVSTKDHARRVTQLGENPERIHVTGAPGLDAFASEDIADRVELETFLGLPLKEKPIIVTFHPVTLEPGTAAAQFLQLLAALSERVRPVIITYPNADSEGAAIINEIERFAADRRHVAAVKSLGSRRYCGLMKIASAMIGNSSSGIIEAASFELPVVNIGDRQRGRTRGANVIDVAPNRAAISEGLSMAESEPFRASLRGMENPYGDGKAAPRIVRALKTVHLDADLFKKTFYDLNYPLPISTPPAHWRKTHA